ncbi:DUF2059 domain-containing protein [Massilia sp. ST3]|uniref:DUF2059 domain-containing protein n=1 Tax=Massilia sp. ST3 TaxID=2824903 RepID=UPI001B81C50B|nr:DUF2059 domain-containing protein [Massilia sp. ST3]MBQ5948971.1 DUF2059 domain-containing protein [Massilia sp. ST3]
MKKIVLVLSAAAAFAGLPSLAFAADAQTTAAAKNLLEVMDARKTMVASFAEMEKAMPSMMHAQAASMIQNDAGLNAAQKRDAMAKVDKVLPGVAQALNQLFRDPGLVDEMMAEMVPMYADNFTVAEIDQLTAFYATSVGRKMMTLMPKLSAESVALSQKIVLPRVGKLMQQAMQDIQKQ